MTDPVDPYQNENSSFSAGGERPEQTEEQLSKAFDITEFMRDVIDPDFTPQELTPQIHMMPERVEAAMRPLDGPQDATPHPGSDT